MEVIKFIDMDSKQLNIKYINLELTTRCNLNCPFCSRKFKPFRLNPVKEDFELEWIDKIPFESIEKLILCGSFGDSIFYPHLHQFLERVLNINKKMTVTFHTNGTAHNTEWWKRLSKLLMQFKNHQITFALDGLEDTNQIHRVGGNFNKTLQNMKTMIGEGCSVVWQTIIFKYNQHQLVDMHKLSKKLGCDNFIIRKSFFYGGVWERPTFPQVLTKSEMGQKNMGSLQCRMDYGEIAILANGDIIPCCHVIPVNYKSLGVTPMNLKDHTVQDALDNGYMQRIWNEASTKDFCQNCRNITQCSYTVEQLIIESLKVRRLEREQKKVVGNKI